MSVTQWACFVLLCLVAAFLSGCGNSGPPNFTVKGSISFDGKPLTHGTINFFPSKGKPLGGPIQSDGTYVFELPEGTYRVAVRSGMKLPEGWKEGDAFPEQGATLPTQYARPDTSGLVLTVTVQNEPQVEDFKL